MSLTRAQVIRSLRRLERGWPADLKLFADAGAFPAELLLVEADSYERLLDEHGESEAARRFRGNALARFRIRCDGGDP